jgi:hypothetical protein
MSNKAEVVKWFIDHLREIQPDSKNIEMYEQHFSEMSEEDFRILMQESTITLPWYAANLVDESVDIERAMKVGESLGINFFQQLWMTDTVTGVKYLTPEQYLILTLIVRRQSQHLTKGLSVTENANSTDTLTGAATGKSTASQLSLPEIVNLDAMGLHHNLDELTNVMGGNIDGNKFAKRQLIETGDYSLKEVKALDSRPTVVDTLSDFLTAMHFKNNL